MSKKVIRTDKKSIRIQCGYESEDECKLRSCLECNRMLPFNSSNITLAEATCIETFSIADIPKWSEEQPERVALAQDIMGKLNKRVGWKEP